MEDFLLRVSKPEDIDVILQMDELWEAEDIAHEYITENLEEYTAKLKRFPEYILVAESNGTLVGYINGSIHNNEDGLAVIPAGETYLEIENLYVKPEFRHKGIGGRLMQSLLEVAEGNGIRRFILATDNKQMDKMLSFYKRFGFNIWFARLYK